MVRRRQVSFGRPVRHQWASQREDGHLKQGATTDGARRTPSRRQRAASHPELPGRSGPNKGWSERRTARWAHGEKPGGNHQPPGATPLLCNTQLQIRPLLRQFVSVVSALRTNVSLNVEFCGLFGTTSGQLKISNRHYTSGVASWSGCGLGLQRAPHGLSEKYRVWGSAT